MTFILNIFALVMNILLGVLFLAQMVVIYTLGVVLLVLTKLAGKSMSTVNTKITFGWVEDKPLYSRTGRRF